MDYFETIKELINSVSDISIDRIKLSSNLTELGLSSLDYTELIMSIEDEYDILIDDDNETFCTVEDLVNRVISC